MHAGCQITALWTFDLDAHLSFFKVVKQTHGVVSLIYGNTAQSLDCCDVGVPCVHIYFAVWRCGYDARDRRNKSL